MTVLECAGCDRLISVSEVPGGNRFARQNPDRWSMTHTTCGCCGRTYCDRCTAPICPGCGEAIAGPDRPEPGAGPAHASKKAHHRGLRALELGQLDDALDAFDEAIRLPGGVAESHYHRGGTLLRLGRVQDALAAFDAAARQNAGYPDALFEAGLIRLQLGQGTEAAVNFDRALRIDAGHVGAAAARMEMHLGAHRPAEAVRIGEAALVTAQKPSFTLLALVHAFLGDALLQLHRDEEALSMLDRAAAIGEDRAALHRNRAVALRRLRREGEARFAERIAARLTR
jgi:tetratricopeptide (TPR) repeat protein